MALASDLFAMLLAVMFSGVRSRVLRLPVPLVQIALGAARVTSGLGEMDLEPEVFFIVLLPALVHGLAERLHASGIVAAAPKHARVAEAAERVAGRCRERPALCAEDAAVEQPTGTLTEIERQALVAMAAELGLKDKVLQRLVREVDLQEARHRA